MLTSRCLETEGQNAQIHHRQVNLTLHGLRKARRNETDRYCSIVIQGSCLTTRVTRLAALCLHGQGFHEVLVLPHERVQELKVSDIYQNQLINHLGDKSKGWKFIIFYQYITLLNDMVYVWTLNCFRFVFTLANLHAISKVWMSRVPAEHWKKIPNEIFECKIKKINLG